jgi:hypothetical protein
LVVVSDREEIAMHYAIYTILRAFTAVLPSWSDQVPAIFKSEECGEAELSKNADCEVLQGEICQQACFDQKLDQPCIVECGLQNCHDYSCFEWRCVADCTDQHVTSCLDGCSAPAGALFCDASYVVSGQDISACLDFLCEHEVSVQDQACY